MSQVSQDIRETKEERFVRLATKRTQVALHKINLVGNLASPSYRCTDEQVQKIIGALREAVDGVERKFRKEGETKRSFSL